MDLRENEYISYLIIDSNDRSSGDVYDFIVPREQENLNMIGIDRFAVDSFHSSSFYYDINEFNRYFQVADSSGLLYNISLPIGIYNYTITSPSTYPAFDISGLQNSLNTQASGLGSWTVTWSWQTYQYTISCTNPFTILVPTNRVNEILDTYGLYTTTTPSTTYITGHVSLLYSGVFYVCSNRLCRYNSRDVVSNPKISNVLFEISVSDFKGIEQASIFRNEFQTLKIQKWDESMPIGIVDIYIVDRYGNKLISTNPFDRGNYLQFRIKTVKKYSEQQSKIKSF